MKFIPINKPIWVTDKKGKSFEKFAKTCRAVWHGRFAPHDEAAKKKQAVTLRGLDKITARIVTFHAPVDEIIQYGSMTIMARFCKKARPEETPEVSVFLEIDDQRPGRTKSERIFTGWMFASSPAVSALEHPVYDVWVTDCSMVSVDKMLSPHRKSAK